MWNRRLDTCWAGKNLDRTMQMGRPNFFIVGAPKCGTTALYHALLNHPEVCLPHSADPEQYWLCKEPMHFCGDLGIVDWLRVADPGAYLSLFAHAGEAKRIGEASAQYLFSTEAPRRIREFVGDEARIVIMLRPPVDWMRSWHHDCLRYAHETIGDFGKALAAEPDRARGERIPTGSGFGGCLLYRKQAHFSGYVARYFEIFGRERVKVALMEDLNRDPGALLNEIAAFLGITPLSDPQVERQNDSGVLSRTHLWEFRLSRKLRRLPGLERLIPWRLYNRVALKLLPPLSDKSIDPALHEQLIEEFRPEVARLGELIGRDLSHWNQRSQRSRRGDRR